MRSLRRGAASGAGLVHMRSGVLHQIRTRERARASIRFFKNTETNISMTRPVRSGTIQRHCIETATNIAIRITDEAMWHGDACTWMVTSHDAERGRDAFKIVPASESLYQGASGIALFLAEIWGVTGDRRMVECASGALRHCATGKPRRRANLALHSGQVGVALYGQFVSQR